MSLCLNVYTMFLRRRNCELIPNAKRRNKTKTNKLIFSRFPCTDTRPPRTFSAVTKELWSTGRVVEKCKMMYITNVFRHLLDLSITKPSPGANSTWYTLLVDPNIRFCMTQITKYWMIYSLESVDLQIYTLIITQLPRFWANWYVGFLQR